MIKLYYSGIREICGAVISKEGDNMKRNITA